MFLHAGLKCVRVLAGRDKAACMMRNKLVAVSRVVQNACDESNPALCNALAQEAIKMRNVVYGQPGNCLCQ